MKYIYDGLEHAFEQLQPGVRRVVRICHKEVETHSIVKSYVK
jgi:hypothetical protein